MRHYLKFLIYFLIIIKIFGQDYTVEELIRLKQMNAISQEDFELLKNELESENQGIFQGKSLYTLRLNSRILAYDYPVYGEKGAVYLNITRIFELIDFKNYEQSKNKLIASLGYRGDKLELVFKDKLESVIFRGKKYTSKGKMIKVLEDGVYLEENIFREIFTSSLEIDNRKLLVDTYLNFTLPDEVLRLLDAAENKLKKQEEYEEIFIYGERKPFELGYAKVYLGSELIKSPESTWEHDWRSDIEYQGPFLYGQFTGNYDVKENEVGLVELEYADVYRNHNFEIQNRKIGRDRSWKVGFYKDKGFYEYGQRVIIREKVPLGSRGELIYLGVPIAIENERNGEIVFENNIIRSNRKYLLKIYTPEGKIISKEIKTHEDYNQQREGEIEYRFFAEEYKRNGTYPVTGNIFYGLSDDFTLGLGYGREYHPGLRGEKYLNRGDLELIHGRTINGYSYVLKGGLGKSLDHHLDREGRELGERESYSLLGDLKFGKYKFLLSHERMGRYYDEKESTQGEAEYFFLNNLRGKYRYDRRKFYSGKTDDRSGIELNGDYNFRSFLFYFDSFFYLDREKEDAYSVAFFHKGLRDVTTRLEHKWTESGENYETGLTFFNNNFRGFVDYNLEFKYSKRRRDLITFAFVVDIGNWFQFRADGDNRGNRIIGGGIDRVIDLKNPLYNIYDRDVSRVKITTFIDENLNNRFDSHEETIGDVKVQLGQEAVVTDENGEGMFYGISNRVIHDLKPTVKNPYYTLGNSVVKVQSKFSTTVEAAIPLKPLLNLSGEVEIEGADIFNGDILVELLDNLGKRKDILFPDDTGLFDISELMPGEYILRVNYTGEKYSIPLLEKKLNLKYEKNRFDYQLKLKVTEKEILYLDS